MGETPNDSGVSPTEQLAAADVESVESERIEHLEPVADATTDPRIPSSNDVRTQIERPAVWGLVVLIIVTVAIQIWLLFL